MHLHVTIVGAGIIGLTTACTLLKEYADCEQLRVVIISERFSPETTADLSAGYWEPYGFDRYDPRIISWAGYTYDIFQSECFSSKAARAGLSYLPAYSLFLSNDQQHSRPDYAECVRHFRTLNDVELKIFKHLKVRTGYSMSTMVVNVSSYLREIQNFLSYDHRIRFIRRKLHSFDELLGKTDLIINCTGLGARKLARDFTVRPARGQIIRISAPWIKSVFNFETDEGEGYIIPEQHSVVLGGTFQLDNWNTNVDPEDTRKILRMCAKCLPALANVRYGSVQVGLRPHRDAGVRLEYEKTDTQMNIIHCYGHSGSGVTLSWGCAKTVIERAEIISSSNSTIRSC